MATLGQTSDPTALIPGDPASVYQTEAEVRSYGDLMYTAGEGLQRIDTTDGWSGAAADAFRKVYSGQPRKWVVAGDAFHAAANALKDYANVLAWAQGQASVAISQWNAGSKQAAAATLANAQGQLNTAGNTAAATVGQARDLAPPAPGFWSQIGSDALSFLSHAGHALETAGEDTLGALASVGNAMLHDTGAFTEILGGLGLATLSAGGEVGGAALDLTGIGAILGVPVGVLSAAGIVGGVSLAGAGLHTVVSDAAGPDRVTMMNSQGSGGGGGTSDPVDGTSNRVRPPMEGDTNYVVDNPDDLSDTVTDIDRVEDGTLWEEKTATGQNPNMDTPGWVEKNVAGKLNSYTRARQYLPGYENAPLGLDFTQPGATPEFKAAVEQAVDQWKAANPGVQVTVRWAS